MAEQPRVYEIRISGCDAATKFMMELTDIDASVVQRLAKMSEKVSEYECMPILHCDLMEDKPNGD